MQANTTTLPETLQSARPDGPPNPTLSVPEKARFVGHAASPEGRYTRLVERLTVLETPLPFRTVCERVLSERTRYLILDLDRTTHRGRNLGELLGWEIAAYRVYGEGALERLKAAAGRFLWNPEQPWQVLGYFAEGVRTWAFPGLSYLLWGKLPSRIEALEGWAYRKFGPEPIQAVQRVPQTALLHKLSTLPQETLRMLARRVWERARDDQVITRADLAWVRERCPGIKILITSASPKPMLEVAAEQLGVDAVEYSSTTEHEQSFSAPYWVDRRFVLGGLERIATPEQVHINSGQRKIVRLLERYPDLAQRDVESVGVSDTGYGEDHAWAQYLSVVVDVNSTAPFPPVVAFDSPLRQVYSVKLLTQRELETQSHPTSSEVRTYDASELTRLLSTHVAQVETLAALYRETADNMAALLRPLVERHARAMTRVSESVEVYNRAQGKARELSLNIVRKELRRVERARKALVLAEVPMSLLRMQITRAIRSARASLP